jgi:2-keto-4-pentenoate hydratase/2-oxohepta-3-ene-1,7-dioic acid hydratase in catechol pathway
MKVICIGWNYPAHNNEMQAEAPANPTVFCKPDSALLKQNKPFYVPDFMGRIDYELELVVKINRLGKGIAAKFASRYYTEVGLGIDFTARDMQNQARANGQPWDLCKGFDNSAAVSEFYPLTNFGTINNLRFRLDINGVTVQQGYTGDMLFKTDDLIAYVSQYYTLKIGDLLFTGTPEGVGQVHPGDRLQAYLEDQLLMDFEIK